MSEIGRLYDEIMAASPDDDDDDVMERWWKKSSALKADPPPVPTRRGLEASIADILAHGLSGIVPVNVVPGRPRVTSERKGDKIVFTARVDVQMPPRDALAEMRESIDDGQESD